MGKIRQLTVISGKGGTGKTSIVGAFAFLAKDKVLADCDVDAADLHLLLQPKIIQEQDFKAMKTAVIDRTMCVKCGRCAQHCRFDAIKDHAVSPFSCEGCGVCEFVCPAKAIRLEDKTSGKSYISETRFGTLCHARLKPGEEASGKLVALVRHNARKIAKRMGHKLIIIDGSPGTGCPVIASIGGADCALIITEPTLSAMHDLKRILGVARHFGVRPMVCVNKYDINQNNADEIELYCRKNGVDVTSRIPYDPEFTKAQIKGKTIVEYSNGKLADIVKGVWDEVNDSL